MEAIEGIYYKHKEERGEGERVGGVAMFFLFFSPPCCDEMRGLWQCSSTVMVVKIVVVVHLVV